MSNVSTLSSAGSYSSQSSSSCAFTTTTYPVNISEQTLEKAFNDILLDREAYEKLDKNDVTALRKWIAKVTGYTLEGVPTNPEELEKLRETVCTSMHTMLEHLSKLLNKLRLDNLKSE